MRIHHLELTAFGPFSGTEAVDFEVLTEAGLFLLCGPTGAGKTSVLDAVCFGLYGEVPGDRNSAKRLRSDHAAPGVVPVVQLEVSIGGRRFRIRRSPSWQRPKKRGSGTITEQAKVNLEEQVDGGWLHLSNRLDETGHLMTDLLGMNVSQFTQVAMLPQGRFQSFLRAKSDERHKVLQRLFRTSRFEDIERWLVTHRQSLRAANQAHQDLVGSVVSRLSEASGTDLPEGWELHDLAVPAGEGSVGAWADELVAAAAAVHEETGHELATAAASAEQARARLHEAQRTLAARDRHREAVDIDHSLVESAEQAAEAHARLDAARRAAAVTPLLRVAGEAADAAESAQQQLGEVLAEAARLLGTEAGSLQADQLAAAEREAHEAATVAKALLPREAELSDAQRTVEATTRALADLAGRSTTLEAQRTSFPSQVEQLRRRLAEEQARAGSLESVADKEQQLVDRLAAARKALALTAEIRTAREVLQASIDVAQARRETMHDIREARITGMAAELAASLASGGCCPVCGSAEHPAVAEPVAGAPSRADEESARSAYEDADFTRQAQAETLATLERNLALAEQASGGQDVETLQESLARARELLDGCRAAGAEAGRLTTRLEALEADRERVERECAQVQQETARLRQELTHARTRVDTLTAELSALFEREQIADSVERLIEAKSAAGAAFAQARTALVAREAAAARAEEARRQAADCAREHNFDGAETAAAAALGEREVTALEERLRVREELRSRAQTILDDPAVQAALQAEPPDLVTEQRLTRDAESLLTDCGARARLAATRMQRLSSLRNELTAGLAAWAPTRSAYAVAQSLSTFAEGKGGDNRLQMRLSAYVLASRLRQVVAAANERLRSMSDERYTLEHSAARGVGEQRGGLSLLVRDEWTGESRDPATLSGGETFVASLALALGLADVVMQEAGGAQIDTLFIDEGFGSLDPETLDDVMDTLDGLRDGGRVVGIVSHVPEMRTRVPAQLQIRKDRGGSRVVAARETG